MVVEIYNDAVEVAVEGICVDGKVCTISAMREADEKPAYVAIAIYNSQEQDNGPSAVAKLSPKEWFGLLSKIKQASNEMMSALGLT